MNSRIPNTQNPIEVRQAFQKQQRQIQDVADKAASDALVSHESESDPHPQYLTEDEGDAAYESLGTATTEVGEHESTYSHENIPTEDEKAALVGTSGSPSALNPYATKATADLKADLVDGKVPASQLPAYVDDVLEYDTTTSFPETGSSGIIYVAQDTNYTYRWSGTAYVRIAEGVALGETSSTAYRGDRGKTAYDHSQDSTVHVTADEKAALAGTEGTPSASNPFVTDDDPRLLAIAVPRWRLMFGA